MEGVEHPIRTRHANEVGSRKIIAGLGFSACGNYITISYPGLSWPFIYPIGPDHTRNRISEATETTRECGRIAKRPLDTEGEDAGLCSAMRISKLPKVIHSDSLVLNNSAGDIIAHSSMRLAHESNPQSLELVSRTQDANLVRLSLARMPSQINLRNVHSTVKLPSKEQSNIQVTLNAIGNRIYGSDESHVSPLLPAVLSIDPRSLAAPQDTYPRTIADQS